MAMKPRTVRMLWVVALLFSVAAVVFGLIRVFNDNLVFFYTPTELANGQTPAGRGYRVGGMVERGSLIREPGSTRISFRVTDLHRTITVRYDGITPDLFKEGKGVIAQGRLDKEVFVATEILAKHDENYSPPILKK